MCGIVGTISFAKVTSEKIRKNVAIHLFTEILEQTEARGKDATGVATLFADGNFFGQKGNVTASEHLAKLGEENTDFRGFLKLWRTHKERAVLSIGHCRKSSVGNTSDNANNHPIKVGNIVGIHNGTLKNHDVIFEKLKSKRDGQVDSEAIMRLFYKFTKSGQEPFTLDIVESVANKLDGSYSVLAFNGNNPYQLVAMNDLRPMVGVLIKPVKLLVIASEMSFIKNAIISYNKAASFYDSKLPYFEEKDLVYKTFVDGNISVFYLERDVTATTTIEDLCDFKKTFFASKEDDWKEKYVAPASTNGVVYAKNANSSVFKAPEVSTNSATKVGAVFTPEEPKKSSVLQLAHTSTNAGKDANNSVRIWNPSANSYEVASKQYADFMATVVIGPDLSTVELTSVSADVHSPVRVGFDAKNNTQTSPVKLEKISLVDIDLSKPVSDMTQQTATETDTEPESSVEPSWYIGKFESMEDIANYLQIPLNSIISKTVMELCSLVRKAAFMEGLIKGKSKKQLDERLSNAASLVGALKNMVKVVLNNMKKEVNPDVVEGIAQNIDLGEHTNALKKIFRPGDFISCTPLVSIKGLRGEVNEAKGNPTAIQ